MKGCRPLQDDEIRAVLNTFHRRDPNYCRNRALFVTGYLTGFRASELLSLRIGDVWQHGCIVDTVEVKRAHMKGKRASRQIVLHKHARAALRELIQHYQTIGMDMNPEGALFASREGGRAICYVRFWQLMKRAFAAARLTGKLACHTLRKTFARLFLSKSNDNILGLQRLLGHSSPTVTMCYASFRDSVYMEVVSSF